MFNRAQGFKSFAAHLYPNIARVPPPPPRDGVELRSDENSIALHLVVRAVVGCAYNSSMLPLKYTGNQLSGTRLRDLLVSLRDTYIRAIFTTLLIFKICFILKSDQSF